MLSPFVCVCTSILGQMDKPDVDYIEGLSPAISIDQRRRVATLVLRLVP